MQLQNSRYSGMGESGQALLVAVLLMLVILLTGILFVAIVTYNQQQSSRHGDVNLAQSLAEAGIQWANRNLVQSPWGADWRPPFRPLNSNYDSDNPGTWPVPPVMDIAGNSYGIYGPDGAKGTEDDYYTSMEIAHKWHGVVNTNTGNYIRRGFYRIPDIQASEGDLPPEVRNLADRGHFLVRVTYDPDPPYEPYEDYEPNAGPAGNVQPEPMSNCIKIESVGVVDMDVPVYRHLVAYKPLGLTDYTFFVTDKKNSGAPFKLGFDPFMDMDQNGLDRTSGSSDWLKRSFYGPIRCNTTLQLNGAQSSGGNSSSRIYLTPGPTAATSEVPGINSLGITGGYLRNDHVIATDGISEPRGPNTTRVYERAVDGSNSSMGTIQPSGSGFTTYQGLVKDGVNSPDSAGYSRYAEEVPAPDIFSDSGRGADRYRALTRDSGQTQQVQLPSGDIRTVNLGEYGFGRGLYIDNKADLQFVSGDDHDIQALMSDWMQDFSAGAVTRQSTGWNDTYTTYVPAGVEITLYPTESAALQGASGYSEAPPTTAGTVWWPNHVPGEPGIKLTRHDHRWPWYDSANDSIVDSGQYVMYRDYPRYPNQVIFAEGNVRVSGILPQRNINAGNDVYRDYNLSIVSGGTIYIDGQILDAQDVAGRNPGTGASGLRDEYDTQLGLIARDCVVLNATQIAAGQVQGSVSAAPDDPYNPDPDQQHWELRPEVQGAAYSQWRFGEPVLNNHDIGFAAVHTGTDPGPAAMSMYLFDGTNWLPYTFGGIGDTNRYYFLGPGGPAQPNVAQVLSPDWAVNHWNINSVDRDVNSAKAVSVTAVDPGTVGASGGATEYQLKKWKISEIDGNGNFIGAVHAKINAVMYAENGCWFVIPGRYFDPRQADSDAWGYLRYNYDIAVRGSITEAFHAEPGAVREWCDKWAWPSGGTDWWTIRYEYDESIRATRDPRALRPTTLDGSIRYADSGSSPMVGMTSRTNLPKIPCLPVSRELIFQGEAR